MDNTEEKEILVTVSMTLSKTFPIKVTDYGIKTEGYDEETHYIEEPDFSCCDLVDDVRRTTYLPCDIIDYLRNRGDIPNNILEDLSNWNIDDFVVIKE